ncbi:MAG: tripartite tricarboxylate transporter substrate binding protein [Gemmatimonadales bacterium]|nr:tripartite tricarboxylate transporter substrate binding protein [Gemmatimonadales bacterium]
MAHRISPETKETTMRARIPGESRWAAAVLGVTIFAIAASVSAQPAFPAKEVRVVVPQATGGATDALARIMAAKLAERWGQPVVVENRVGANGNIGTDHVAKAPADGHTLLMTYEGTHATSPALYPRLPWDPVRDFVAVAPLAVVPFVMVVNAKLPAQNLPELITLAKKQELNSASPGNGSLNHLLGERFNRATGIKTLHVPYKGISQVMVDLIAGRVDVTFSSIQSVRQHVKSGALRPIAVTSATRSELMPEVPTLAELGVSGIDVNPWFGVLAPAGTPAALVSRLNRDINEVMNAPGVSDQIRTLGAVPLSMTSEAFDTRIGIDLANWSRVVQEAGIKLE